MVETVANTRVDIDNLATELADDETERRRARIAITHAHLPELVDARIVVWRPGLDHVGTTADLAAVRVILDVLDAVTSLET